VLPYSGIKQVSATEGGSTAKGGKSQILSTKSQTKERKSLSLLMETPMPKTFRILGFDIWICLEFRN
jgi:hypothetical protein